MHNDTDDAVVIQPLRDLAQRPRVIPGRERVALLVQVDLDPVPGVCASQESWVDVVQGMLDQRVPHYNPKVEPITQCRPKPRLRIKWGNVAAYISMLMLVALLLWILIDYTNVPR